jgi:hypothetical protein
MAQHTPGPWRWWTSNSWRRLTSEATDGINRQDGGVLCPVVQNDGHPDVLFSNGGPDGPDARLIAAAPELLAALEGALLVALRFGTFLDSHVIAMVAAIAKAKGSTPAEVVAAVPGSAP